ncbi:MAG: VTT domain-containing protein [Chloroflexi bacterium]|nr:VTT domain-containing protein [Chloroflexota bacterium]
MPKAPPRPARGLPRSLRRAIKVLLPDQRRFWAARNLVRPLLLVAVAALIASSYLLRHDIVALASEDALKRLGYVPVFVLPLVSSASIVLPLPGAAVIFLGGALLAPVLVGLVAGAGETLGELTGYAAGYSAGPVVERGRRYQVVASWMRRHGTVVLFLLAVVPNPLFDLAGMAAGAARYPLWRFFSVILVGKAIKDTGMALAGAWGARGLADWLGPLFQRPQG